MRTTLFNTIFLFFIVIIGITLSSGATADNDEYVPAVGINTDWVDFDMYSPVHQLDARAAKSRFWKRVPHRKFWKRSISNNQN